MRVPPTQKRPKKAVSPLGIEMYRFWKSAKNAKFGGSRFFDVFSLFDIKKRKTKVIFKRDFGKEVPKWEKSVFFNEVNNFKAFFTNLTKSKANLLKRVKKRLELIPKI